MKVCIQLSKGRQSQKWALPFLFIFFGNHQLQNSLALKVGGRNNRRGLGGTPFYEGSVSAETVKKNFSIANV